MSEETPRRKKLLPRVISTVLVAIGVALLKLKAFLVALFVNPFEGFGAAQYAIAGGSMVVTIAAYATKFRLGLVVGFVLVTLIHEIGHAIVIRAKGLRAGF